MPDAIAYCVRVCGVCVCGVCAVYCVCVIQFSFHISVCRNSDSIEMNFNEWESVAVVAFGSPNEINSYSLWVSEHTHTHTRTHLQKHTLYSPMPHEMLLSTNKIMLIRFRAHKFARCFPFRTTHSE